MSRLDKLSRRKKIAVAISSTIISVSMVTLAAIFTWPIFHPEESVEEPVLEEVEVEEEAPKPETTEEPEEQPADEPEKEKEEEKKTEPETPTTPTTPSAPAATTKPSTTTTKPKNGVCPTTFGKLMLINPNFTVSEAWIASRRAELVNITTKYGIKEGNKNNGAPLLDPEAATHLNDMLTAYTKETGGTMTTRSCFRSRGTNCGRLCYATGTSDHHTGYTCDLIDDRYGNSLNTDYYDSHPEWQWLKANSYKYGFIDRFPAAWAGGPMSKPMNVDANGTTGLYEVWHYRYVGVEAATEIATGKYNNGKYDSLEHYLKAIGKIPDLLGPAVCK